MTLLLVMLGLWYLFHATVNIRSILHELDWEEWTEQEPQERLKLTESYESTLLFNFCTFLTWLTLQNL